MKLGAERYTFDPDGMVHFQHERRRALRDFYAGDLRIEPPGTGIVGIPPGPNRGTRAYSAAHMNLTRSLADVDAGR